MTDSKNHSIDWQRFIFDPESCWIDRLTLLAQHRFRNRDTLAIEAFNFALDRISMDEWSKMKSYTGLSNPGTFLIAVFNNLLEDFSRARFGRIRPPLWLVRLGDFWTHIFQLLCKERLAPETIVDWMSAHGKNKPDAVRNAIRLIRSKIPNCGMFTEELSVPEISESENAIEDISDTPESLLIQEDLATLLEVLSKLLGGSAKISLKGPNRKTLEFTTAVFRRRHVIQHTVQISDEDRLILRLIYQKGWKVPSTAQALGLPEHQVRSRLKRTEKSLRAVLQEEGFTADVIRTLFNDE